MRPELNEDFVDMLHALDSEGAEFIVVGAHALAALGFARATGDIDIFVRPTPDNAARVFAALRAFGAPLAAHGVTREDFVRPDNVYQIGLPPRRIDILTAISGVTFEDAWSSRLQVELGGIAVSTLGRGAMIRNKRAAARPKDLIDADVLERGGGS